jgi:hypothetical protein
MHICQTTLQSNRFELFADYLSAGQGAGLNFAPVRDKAETEGVEHSHQILNAADRIEQCFTCHGYRECRSRT